MRDRITPFSGLPSFLIIVTRGDVLRFASHLPLAIIFRAFGAKSARLALNGLGFSEFAAPAGGCFRSDRALLTFFEGTLRRRLRR